MSDGISKQELKAELDELTIKLFKYFDGKFSETNKRFDTQEAKIDRVMNAVDAYAKQVEIYHHESIARDAQVERLQHFGRAAGRTNRDEAGVLGGNACSSSPTAIGDPVNQGIPFDWIPSQAGNDEIVS